MGILSNGERERADNVVQPVQGIINEGECRAEGVWTLYAQKVSIHKSSSGLAGSSVGIGEVLLEDLGVANGVEVGVSLSLLGRQPLL